MTTSETRRSEGATVVEKGGTADADRPRIGAGWLALLAAPTALGANAASLVLPNVASSLGVGLDGASWVATAFGWGITVGTPCAVVTLRKRGPRTAILAGTVLVVLGVLGGLLAPSLGVLLPARVLLAVGGAALVTTALTQARGTRQLGVITATTGVFGAVGPLAGSLIAESVTWRLALVMSVLSLLAVPALLRGLPRTERTSDTPVDPLGMVLTIGVLTALVAISHFGLVAVLAAVVLAVGLGLHVWRKPGGFLPRSLARSPRFGIAALGVCVLSSSYFLLLYIVPQTLREVTHWSTSTVGVGQMIALVIGSAVSWFAATRLGRARRSYLIVGLVVLGLAGPAVLLAGYGSPVMLAAPLLAVLANSTGQATLTAVGSEGAGDDRTTAVSLVNLCYQLGGAFGPSIAGLLLV